MYYYPYYYFPHSYWPQQSPQWPEPKGAPYVRPPAYMAYPPFIEPNWRHELWQPQKYYRGQHFWLDCPRVAILANRSRIGRAERRKPPGYV